MLISGHPKRTAFLLISAALVVAAGAWLYPQLQRPVLGPTASLTPGAAAKGRLSATFFGVSTLLFSDGDSSILIDGFFSRPSGRRLLTGPLTPDPERIAYAYREGSIPKIDAVFVAHSHYDHALDSVHVAKKDGAVLVGSESTANIARASSFPENLLRPAADRRSFEFGRIKVTVLKSLHSPGALFPGDIFPPPHLPAKIYEYKEGGSYSFLIEHGDRKVIVHPSAGFRAGMYAGVTAEVVFLGIGKLGDQDPQFREQYWNEVVRTSGASVVVPIHWDDFTLPLKEGLKPMLPLFDKYETAIATLSEMAGRPDAGGKFVKVRFCPPLKPVDIFAQIDSGAS